MSSTLGVAQLGAPPSPVTGGHGSSAATAMSRGRSGSPAQAMSLVLGRSPSCSSGAHGGREVLAEVLDEVCLGLWQDTVNDGCGDPALWERKHPKFGPTGSKRVGVPIPGGRYICMPGRVPLVVPPQITRRHLPSGPC